MKTYRVVWSIDIEADSPIEAAELAQEIILDPLSTANVFEVEGKEIHLAPDY